MEHPGNRLWPAIAGRTGGPNLHLVLDSEGPKAYIVLSIHLFRMCFEVYCLFGEFSSLCAVLDGVTALKPKHV